MYVYTYIHTYIHRYIHRYIIYVYIYIYTLKAIQVTCLKGKVQLTPINHIPDRPSEAIWIDHRNWQLFQNTMIYLAHIRSKTQTGMGCWYHSCSPFADVFIQAIQSMIFNFQVFSPISPPAR